MPLLIGGCGKSDVASDNHVYLRWLGVAGIELTMGDQILVIDPFLTRPPLGKLLFKQIDPNHALVAKSVPRSDFLLVTHSHYDHLIDVSDIPGYTGASVYGSPNTSQLCSILNVPQHQNHQIHIGDHLSLGRFQVEVLPAEQQTTPIDHLINGPLRPGLKPPLRVLDYRMDCCFSFRIQVGRYSLLHGAEPVPAEILCIAPFILSTRYKTLLQKVQPKLIIPIHWDNMFRPLSKPLRRMFGPFSRLITQLRRMDPFEIKREIEDFSGEVEVFIPELFRYYAINELLQVS